jgi:allene oxide cyclase
VKRNLVIALLVAAAVPVGVASVATADGDHGKNKKRLVVVERATTDTVVDNAPAGDSIGDLLAFGNELFDKTNTTKVGTDQGSCVRTIVGVAWECSWTNSLEGGQITVQGPFLDAGDSTLAITGGTGRYKSAHGTMKLHALSAEAFELTFSITR